MNDFFYIKGVLDTKLLAETLDEDNRDRDFFSIGIDTVHGEPSLSNTTITGHHKSFLLIDRDEKLVPSNFKEFVKIFGGQKTKSSVNVISIFGKIGDGKSHTLNASIFNDEVFKTSSEQGACTKGVYGAYDPEMNALVLDTEGMSGSSGQENQKIRILWKVSGRFQFFYTYYKRFCFFL